LYYNFHLLITPFHTINTEWQWENRFYHKYVPIEKAKESGANVINIHHGTDINPYINYPFIATKEMKDYINKAHQSGLKVKIYNTIREVSNRMYELYPVRSLGHEVFLPEREVVIHGCRNIFTTIILPHGMFRSLKMQLLSIVV
jgi:hypothetical protein